MNESLSEIGADLRHTLTLYRQVLGLVETENQALRHGEHSCLYEGFAGRKHLLPELEQSAARLREHRGVWARLSAAERAGHPEISGLLRQCQDLVMKALMMDRENEQGLLRQGLLGPRHLPPHQRQRPNFVANLYRHQGGA